MCLLNHYTKLIFFKSLKITVDIRTSVKIKKKVLKNTNW